MLIDLFRIRDFLIGRGGAVAVYGLLLFNTVDAPWMLVGPPPYALTKILIPVNIAKLKRAYKTMRAEEYKNISEDWSKIVELLPDKKRHYQQDQLRGGVFG